MQSQMTYFKKLTVMTILLLSFISSAQALEEIAPRLDSEIIDAVGQLEPKTNLVADATPAAAPAESIIKKSETDFPIQEPAAAKKDRLASSSQSMTSILAIIAAVMMMGAGAFIAIKRFSTKATSKASQIKLVTQYHLGPKKSLAVIRVAGESMLVGITDNQINLVKSLSLLDEDIVETKPSAKSFKNQLDEDLEEEVAAQEEFSLASLRDSVSVKLKSMRSL